MRISPSCHRPLFVAPHIQDTNLDAGGKDWGQALQAAIIGGTVSDISGGNFANGAATAAFGNLYNQQGDHRSNKRYDEDEVGRRHRDINRYSGRNDTRLFGRALNGGQYRTVIDPESGETLYVAVKVTNYEVSGNPNFPRRQTTIVNSVQSPNAIVIDPHTGITSDGVYGQVDVDNTQYENVPTQPEFRVFRVDKVDHAPLYEAYLESR